MEILNPELGIFGWFDSNRTTYDIILITNIVRTDFDIILDNVP